MKHPYDHGGDQNTSYEDLPEGAKSYIKYVIDALGIKPSLISTGPDREETILAA